MTKPLYVKFATIKRIQFIFHIFKKEKVLLKWKWCHWKKLITYNLFCPNLMKTSLQRLWADWRNNARCITDMQMPPLSPRSSKIWKVRYFCYKLLKLMKGSLSTFRCFKTINLKELYEKQSGNKHLKSSNVHRFWPKKSKSENLPKEIIKIWINISV